MLLPATAGEKEQNMATYGDNTIEGWWEDGRRGLGREGRGERGGEGWREGVEGGLTLVDGRMRQTILPMTTSGISPRSSPLPSTGGGAGVVY